MAPEEWAEEVYRLPNGGRFKWSFAPYTLGMYRSMFDRRVIETSYQIFSRGLKSTVILLAIGYTIDQAPRKILYMMPTTGQVEKFSKDNLCGELLDTTPCLNQYGSKGNRRITNNTILHKNFPGGLIGMFGANAAGELRRAKGSFLIIDEKDAITKEQTDEGDQVQIFWKRGSEYPDTIRVSASYPSLLGHSRIAADLDNSDCNEWFSTCVRCGGEPYVMTRKMLRYDKDKPHEARMECPMCKELLTDEERYQMAHKQGFDNWRARNEFKGMRGFHAGAMLWPHQTDPVKYPAGFLGMLAQQELEVAASEEPRRAMRVLVNTVDALPFDPADETETPPEWKTVFDKREDYGLIVPERGLVLTAFVDVQVNRLEVEWKAHGRNGESWGMDHVVLDGNTRDVEVWRKSLCQEFRRKFKHALGGEIGLSIAMIDGGWASEYVFSFLQWLAANPVEGVTGKVRASKGMGQHGHPIIDRNWKTISKNLKGYHIGTWEAKDLINQRLRMLPDAEGKYPDGFMHYNKRYDEQYFRQLCTGIPTIVFEKVKGKIEDVRKFLNTSHLKDEGLDLAVGNLAAFRLRQWNFDAIEAKIIEDAKPDPKKEERELVAPARSNFVNGWRL